jgi:mannose-6-phosphate isomerase-like protein (cupin superfamily)
MDDPHALPRSRAGDVIENRITGERAIVLMGTADSDDDRLICLLGVAPGGAVASQHYHHSITERCRVVAGRLGVSVDGVEDELLPGDELTIHPGMVHNWWNAGDDEAQVVVEVDRARRFELLITTLFGLANDGLTNDKGTPHLLQLAVISAEFRDVIEAVRPPRLMQRVLFGLLAPIGQALGYRPWYDRYLRPQAHVELAPSLRELAESRAAAVA